MGGELGLGMIERRRDDWGEVMRSRFSGNRIDATMWRRLATVLALTIGLVALATLTACTQAPPDSGIIGTVTIGPAQPVATAGAQTVRPYSADLSIAPKTGLHLKRPVLVTSAADGSFRVSLDPGTYVVAPATDQSSPILTPVEVVVQPHRFVNVEVSFDSGIR